jgi:CRP-like cAMP-binding protein
MPTALDPRWVAQFHDTLSSFADIPEAEWTKAIAKFRHLAIPKEGYFIRPGEKPDKLAFIVKGLFRVCFTTEEAEERILVFREEGRLLSGFSSILSSGTSWFGIQALEDSDLLCMDIEGSDLTDRTECWQQVYARYVEMLFVEKEGREREFLSDSAEKRYRAFRERFPDIERRVAQYHIASYLGITPVALSRIRKKMREV